jgi:SAM-dependent methyltransferase
MHLISKKIKSYLNDDDVILDLCCGIGFSTSEVVPKKTVCVDIFRKYLIEYQSKNPDLIFLNFDVEKTKEVFLENSFDVVMCIDGVEHLPEERAIQLIETMESISRDRVIIFTPESKFEDMVQNNPHNAWNISGGDVYQKHRCGFFRQFFINRGYFYEEIDPGTEKYKNLSYRQMLYVKQSNNSE